MITKAKWVAVMRAAGFTEDDMHRWHREFEKGAPAEHQHAGSGLFTYRVSACARICNSPGPIAVL